MAGKSKLPVGTLEAILAARDVPDTEHVEVPEWGLTVVVRGLTRGEARAFSDLTPVDAEAHALVCGMVEPKVTSEEAHRLLDEKAFRPTERILAKILEVSGITDRFREGEAD